MSETPQLLLTPGPLTTSERTRAAMMRDWGSRDPTFIALTRRVRERITDIAGGGETLAGIFGARSFDSRVQSQQIGLFGDGLNLVGDACDGLDVLLEIEGSGLEIVDGLEGAVETVCVSGDGGVCTAHGRGL